MHFFLDLGDNFDSCITTTLTLFLTILDDFNAHTIRHGTLDRLIQEEEKWHTQPTDLTMVFSTGTAPQEFRQMLNRVRQMSHVVVYPLP